jgi:hypothetical protein
MKICQLFFLFLVVLACGKKNISSSNYPIEEIDITETETTVYEPDFSFEKAIVTEKKGKQEEVSEVIHLLYQHNLIDQENQKKLTIENQNSTMASNFELAKHLDKVILWHTDSLTKPFPYFYQELLDTLFQRENILKPKIKFSPVDTSYIKEGFSSAKLTITLSQKNYEQTIHYEPSAGKMDESFYEVINLILADKQETERYYLIKKIIQFEDAGMLYYGTDKNDYALIKLSESTAYFIHQYPNVLDLSYENHQFSMTKETLKYQLNILDSIGLIPKNINPESLYDHLSSKSIVDTRDIFFHSTAIRQCFSAYTTTFDNVYKRILDSLNTISFQQFSPKNIKDAAKANNDTELSFELNGKTYAFTLSNTIDQIDINTLIAAVNQALNKQHIDGNFYLLNNKDSKFCYIFMKENQVEMVNKLLKQN